MIRQLIDKTTIVDLINGAMLYKKRRYLVSWRGYTSYLCVINNKGLNMLNYFAVQLPFSVCAVWFVLMMIKSKKDYSDRLMLWILGLLALLQGPSTFRPILISRDWL